jgi:DNA-binding winged helix-turn-helix (wHTH) protein/TolB-like protein/cytochrome c-type biogenesis protein CcmH/NrfG
LRWQFGPFECTDSGELSRGGRPVKLQEKPRMVLLALLEEPGALVSRDVLRRRLWHDHTFVDFDNGMNVCIRKLRDALGDDAPPPRYVETVRGQGYRFVAPVQRLAPPPVRAQFETPPAIHAPVPIGASTRRWWPLAVAASIVLSAVVLMAFRARGTESTLSTLAVLPLANQMSDERAALQVDGLTEAVTAELASRVDASVIASQSTFSLRGEIDNLGAVAQRLRADALLVGQVMATPAGVAITVRLIDAHDESVRWSGRFERGSLADQALAGDIVTEILANTRGVSSKASPATSRTRDIRPDAHAAFLRGRFYWAKRGQANAVIATEYLSTAIRLQPDYAEAWAGLADVYAVNSGAPSPAIVPWPGDSTAAGIIAAREALRLSPLLGEAHAALGKLLMGQLRFAEAEIELREAVRLSPNYSTARQWLGTMYSRLRRCDEARTHVEIGARLDPLTALVNEAVGSVYIQCGDPERAVQVLENVLRMHPTAITSRTMLGRALTAAGRAKDGVAILEPIITPDAQSFGTAALMNAYFGAGETAKFRELSRWVTAPYLKAVSAALDGDRERMYAELRRSLAENERSWLTNLAVEPAFAPYSADRDLEAIAGAAGFPIPLRPPPFAKALPATH